MLKKANQLGRGPSTELMAQKASPTLEELLNAIKQALQRFERLYGGNFFRHAKYATVYL